MLLTLIVKLIDPFSFLVALGLTLWLVRRWWQCILVGVAVAVLGELLLTAMQYTRTFGQSIVPAAVAATAHSAIALAITRHYRQRRWVMTGVFAVAFVLTIVPMAIGFIAAMP